MAIASGGSFRNFIGQQMKKQKCKRDKKKLEDRKIKRNKQKKQKFISYLYDKNQYCRKFKLKILHCRFYFVLVLNMCELKFDVNQKDLR